MIKKLCFVVLTAFCFIGTVHCFPVLTGRVVDEANILSEQQKRDLEQVLEQAHPHQVVAVSLKSLDGMEIEDYGYQLGRHWGIGQRGEDDGVLVLIAPNDGQLRIEVGYGLEHILTDAQSSNIVNYIMVPLARQGQYNEALVQSATAVARVLNGEMVDQIPTIQEEISLTTGFVCLICFLLFFILELGIGFVRSRCKDYKKNSKQNRFLFFYENVLLNNSLYGMIVFGMAIQAGFIVFSLIIALFVFCLINIGNVTRWRQNPKFPYKEQWGIGNGGGRGGMFFGGGHSGGSSFHGGGGSFGGGGASGRF